MKMAIFWDVEIALMMEPVSSSEMSVSICQTTWHHIPKDSHLQGDGLSPLLFNFVL
jgi:hypothetical protein